MNYTFQSRDRNVDLGDKIHFRVFNFSTEDDKLAKMARNNCKKFPHVYWETTPAVVEALPVEEKKRVGRPPKSETVRGIRTYAETHQEEGVPA